MRAIGIRSFGGAERLELLDAPVPNIGTEEVLIQVEGVKSLTSTSRLVTCASETSDLFLF